jgi:hypothetical protein
MVDLVFTHYAPDDDIPEEAFEITSTPIAEACGLRVTRTRQRRETLTSCRLGISGSKPRLNLNASIPKL